MIFFSLTFCFFMITAAFWALADDYTGNAVLAGKLLTVCSTLLLATKHPTNTKIGRWCFWIRHMHVWLVHSHRSSFRHRRFPYSDPRRRLVNCYQGAQPEGSTRLIWYIIECWRMGL